MRTTHNVIQISHNAHLIRRSAFISDEGLCRAFRIALLLTANTGTAEQSVQDAICAINQDDFSEDQLFDVTIQYAARARTNHLADGPELNNALGNLPNILRHIVQLSGECRKCYVLRTLVGLSLGKCSNLLDLDIRSIDVYTIAAAIELSRLVRQGSGDAISQSFFSYRQRMAR